MTCLTIRVVIMMPRKNVARWISQRNSASPLIFSVPKFKESHTRWARYFLCLTWHLTCAKTHLVNKTLPWLPCTPLLPQNDIYVFQSVDISSIFAWPTDEISHSHPRSIFYGRCCCDYIYPVNSK